MDLFNGFKSNERDFISFFNKLTDRIIFECLDDDGNAPGFAVAEVLRRYEPDADGAFIQVRYEQVSDPYYEHWVQTSGGGTHYHHLCRQVLRTCQRKVGRDAVVHILRWWPLSKEQVPSLVSSWKTKPIKLGPKTAATAKPVDEGERLALEREQTHRFRTRPKTSLWNA